MADTNNETPTVAPKEIENFKRALYIDGTDEDDLITDYLVNAKAYVQNAVDPNADLTKYHQYDWAVQILVSKPGR